MAGKPPRLGIFHHAGDYLVAAMLLLSIGRSHVVGWPLCIGAIALINAAATRGPLAAYRRISIPAHRVIDLLVVVACVLAAVMVRDHRGDSAVLLAVAVLQAGVVWLSRLAGRADE